MTKPLAALCRNSISGPSPLLATNLLPTISPDSHAAENAAKTLRKPIRDDRKSHPFSDYLHSYIYSFTIMQIFSLRIIPIVATVSFTFAIPAAFADQNIGTPKGTVTVTTPDTT